MPYCAFLIFLLCSCAFTLSRHRRQCQNVPNMMEERGMGTCNLPRQVNQCKSQQQFHCRGCHASHEPKPMRRGAMVMHMGSSRRCVNTCGSGTRLQMPRSGSAPSAEVKPKPIWWCKSVKPKKQQCLHSLQADSLLPVDVNGISMCKQNKLIEHFCPGRLVRPGRCELKGFATN